MSTHQSPRLTIRLSDEQEKQFKAIPAVERRKLPAYIRPKIQRWINQRKDK